MITPEISNTSVSSSDKVRIAALGVGMQGEYGAVTGIARDFGVSRPTVYEKTRRGQTALEEAFGEPKGGKVWATVTVDEVQLRRAIISAYVEGPNSMRDVQALVEAFYGRPVGYGKVFEILEEAMVRAAVFNSFVPLDAIKVAALDELFSQGDPVFAGIDLDSMLPRTGREQAARLKDIADRMAALGGKKVRSLACYLKNRADGLAEHIDHIWEKLAALGEEIGGGIVAICCQLWRRILELRRCPRRDRREHRERAKFLIELIIRLTGDKANEVLERAFAVLRKAHRASSAVENFNALLRPYLHVHKRVSQGFLDLFMAWRNLRTRPMGKHKGTSAYELLTGEKVDDWLTMLGYPPSQQAH